MQPAERNTDSKPPRSRGGAFLVAAGILLSRVSGLVRLRVIAHYLGDSDYADALYAAIKIPNFPQNLFGEGVLSASFIPVYANLLARGERELADRVAGVILSFLTVIVSLITTAGILLTPYLIDVIAPGFSGDKRELTIHLVQIIFLGTGMLVISAWALGVLNSHHKFFISYAAPVLWNAAIIGGLIAGRHLPGNELAVYGAWGVVIGSVLQLAIQLPWAIPLVPHLKLGFTWRLEPVRQIIRSFTAVVVGRGVVQISAYIDNMLATFLPTGAVSALGYAQAIYMLPIGLFGMAISASELPTMSHAFGRTDQSEVLRARIEPAIRKIALFVIPSMAGLLILGDVVVALLFQSGHFDASTSNYVWGVTAGSAVGLLASTLGRLYSSAFYSLQDTWTPLKYSLIRVFLTTVLGCVMGLLMPGWLGIGAQWGTAGLTVSAGIAGWVEFSLLRRGLHRIVGKIELPLIYIAKLWLAALIAAGVGFTVKLGFANHHPVLRGLAVIGIFGVIYFPLCHVLGIQEAKSILNRALLWRRGRANSN